MSIDQSRDWSAGDPPATRRQARLFITQSTRSGINRRDAEILLGLNRNPNCNSRLDLNCKSDLNSNCKSDLDSKFRKPTQTQRDP